MAGWLDRAAASGGLVHLLVYLEIAAGLAAVDRLIKYLSPRRLGRTTARCGTLVNSLFVLRQCGTERRES